MLLPKIGARRRPPGQRPAPALRRAAARAGLPRGPQGHREALQGPLQAAPLRPRRLRRGGDARPDADRPGLRRRRGGGRADLRPAHRAAEADRPALLPAHADVPALRAARHARLPAGQVQDPLPRAHLLRRRGHATPTSRSSRPSPRTSARGSRRTCGTWSASASRSGSGRGSTMDSRRVLITGISTYWGGRLAQALEQNERDRGDHRRRLRGPDPRARAHRVRPRRHPARAAAPDRRRGGDRHRRRHPPDRRLDRRLLARRPREQRHRDDEHPGRLQRPGHDGQEVRLQVVGPLLRHRPGRPGVLHRVDGPAAPAEHADRARHRRVDRGGRRLRREEPGHLGHAAALRERARPGRGDIAQPPAVAAGRADDPGLRPALPVRARGRRRARARARDAVRPARHLQRRAPTACWR